VNLLVLDVKGAAAALGVGETAVRRFIEDGLIPTVQMPSAKYPGEQSRRILIAVSDLEAFVARLPRTDAPAPNEALSEAARERWARARRNHAGQEQRQEA
jgi:hypothetical protein